LSEEELALFDQLYGIRRGSDGYITAIGESLGRLIQEHQAAQVSRIAA